MKEAVALKYEDGMIAPQVIAKGRGFIADRILALAKKHGIHIEENEVLSSGLISIDINQYIPEEWYTLVAELLAFLQKENESSYN